MCGEVHYGEVKELVFVERWSCSSGASCVVMYVHFGEFDGLVTLRCGVCLCQVIHQYRVAV